MAFTDENTQGYSASELDALNVELAAVLADIDPDDTDALEDVEKAFADAVSRR